MDKPANAWTEQELEALDQLLLRFGDWITQQPESVALSAALAFGREFEEVQEIWLSKTGGDEPSDEAKAQATQ